MTPQSIQSTVPGVINGTVESVTGGSRMSRRGVALACLVLAVGTATLTACSGSLHSPLPPVTFAPVPVIVTSAPTTAAATAVASAPPAATGVVSIVLSEYKVDMPATIKAGQADFTIANSGTIPHELLVFQSALDVSAYPKTSEGDIDEEGPGVNLISDGENIDVGGTQTRTVDLSKPGTYLFVCNIPGHFAHGMFTLVTVN